MLAARETRRHALGIGAQLGAGPAAAKGRIAMAFDQRDARGVSVSGSLQDAPAGGIDERDFVGRWPVGFTQIYGINLNTSSVG